MLNDLSKLKTIWSLLVHSHNSNFTNLFYLTKAFWRSTEGIGKKEEKTWKRFLVRYRLCFSDNFFPIKMQFYSNVNVLDLNLMRWEGNSFARKSWSYKISFYFTFDQLPIWWPSGCDIKFYSWCCLHVPCWWRVLLDSW